MNNNTYLSQTIQRLFKRRGLVLRPAALKKLISFLAEVNSDGSYDLNSIVNAIQERQSESFVEVITVENVISSFLEGYQGGIGEDPISFIDPFDNFPQFSFNPGLKTFFPEKGSFNLHASSSSKISRIVHRFHVIQQRVLRHEVFSPQMSIIPNDIQKDSIHIASVQSAISSDQANLSQKCIFGLITELDINKYCIEDERSSILIDLSNAKLTKGILTPGCLVIAEGYYINNIFHITSLIMPPSEPRNITLQVYPIIDFCSLADKNTLISREKSIDCQNDMVIILSEVFLDDPRVMQCLNILFEGLEAVSPLLFIFMGSFCKDPQTNTIHMDSLFSQLSKIIHSFQRISTYSRFCFVPGPDDSTLGGFTLPLSPLPSYMVSSLQSIPHIHFSSNPLRAHYYSQEWVFFRNNILQKLRRHCLIPPSITEDNQIHEHLVKTICDQSHLCPLPSDIQPIYWEYDQSLMLYPLPDVLCLADQTSQYEIQYENCYVFNPGSFSKDQSFVVYRPQAHKAEFSRIELSS